MLAVFSSEIPGAWTAGIVTDEVPVTVDPEGRPVFSDPYYNLVIRVENDAGLLHWPKTR